MHVPPMSVHTRVTDGRTDRQTDRQTDCIVTIAMMHHNYKHFTSTYLFKVYECGLGFLH